MKTGKRRNLRGEPEKRRGGRRRLEEDGKERIAKERQPLFAITDRCGLPGLDVRTEGTGLRSDQSFRCALCGTARLIGFGVDSPSKSRATTTSKEKRKNGSTKNVASVLFKNRGHWIAVRSVVPMRFVWDGSTGRIRCGFAIEKQGHCYEERTRKNRSTKNVASVLFKNRGHRIAVRSVVPMRFVWDGSTDRIRCGFAIEK